jgi:RNA polymerase sigma factor (sigma-70 family)
MLLEEGKVPADDDDQRVTTLVGRASRGDQDAWYELVDRYAPLVYTICTRYRLSNHDIEDVGQNVWLLLVEQLGKLREPAALPGWLATTTARECLRVVTAASKAERLGTGLDDSVLFVDDAVIDGEILVAERNAALRAAFAELPPRCQQLLSMLISDPPHSYAEIHAELGIPVGSIGPQRARCLERMRRSSALAALGEGEEKIDIRGGEPGA